MRVLLVQVTTGADPAQNRVAIAEAVAAGREAAGPLDLIVLPEAVQADFGGGATPLAEVAEPLDGPFVQGLAGLAGESGAVVVGGMFEQPPGHGSAGLPFNTLVAVAPGAGLVATYRKAHLYDAFGYRESDLLSAGDPVAVTVTVPVGDAPPATVGLMTCYDLRFPEQARALVDGGAELLLVPSAWLRGPGKQHHWATLLAARAIENTVYVAGVAKSGERYCGLTRLVDPMGEVVAELDEADGSVVAQVERSRIQAVREVNPSLANRRWDVAVRS
ncbi:MAG: carbon-nitrogen hydrolase family protein [Jiangellales bacterium]